MRAPFPLPYVCGEPGCGCASATDPSDGYIVKIRDSGGRLRPYLARIFNEDRMIVDLVSNDDLAELLQIVHREYPQAKLHPSHVTEEA